MTAGRLPIAQESLTRFVTAQEGVFDRALEELAAGRKRGHWMWFVFPQIRGLGGSDLSWIYGLASLTEARAYLAHPVLGPRPPLRSGALTDRDDAPQPGGRTDRILSWDRVEDMLGISRSTAWRMQQTGDFPKQVKVSPGRVGWWESELTAWKGARDGVIESPRNRKPARAPRLAGMPRTRQPQVPPAPPAAPATLGVRSTPPAPQSKPRKRRRAAASAPNQIDFGF